MIEAFFLVNKANPLPVKCLSSSLKSRFVCELQKKETWLDYRNTCNEFIIIH